MCIFKIRKWIQEVTGWAAQTQSLGRDLSLCFWACEGQEGNQDQWTCIYKGQFILSQFDLTVSYFIAEGDMDEEREESRKGVCKAFDTVPQHSWLEAEELSCMKGILVLNVAWTTRLKGIVTGSVFGGWWQVEDKTEYILLVFLEDGK